MLFARNWDALRAALRQDLVLLFFISAVCWAVYYGGRWQVDAEGTVHVSWRLGVRLDRALRAEGLAALMLEQSLLYRLTGACRVVLYPVGKRPLLCILPQQAEELADVLLPVTGPAVARAQGRRKAGLYGAGANGLSTLDFLVAGHPPDQSYAPDAQTAALAQLGQLAVLAARWLPLGTAWLLVLAGTLFCIKSGAQRFAGGALHRLAHRHPAGQPGRACTPVRDAAAALPAQLRNLRRSPATWALHYCPVLLRQGRAARSCPCSSGGGTPLLRELLPEMAQLPPDTRANTTDRSMIFSAGGHPAGALPAADGGLRTTLPALTLPLLIPTGVFAALLGAAAVGWHREGVWQQQGQLSALSAAPVPSAPAVRVPPGHRLYSLQSPWAVTVQRANLTLVFPGKEKVTVRSVPLAALDFWNIEVYLRCPAEPTVGGAFCITDQRRLFYDKDCII